VIWVTVLDVVAVHRDGVRVDLRAGKATELLVRLALDAGVLVRTDRLIEDLWEQQARDTARNTLQAKVSRLRRALGDADLVTGSRAGYTLNVDPPCRRCAGGAHPRRAGSNITSGARRLGCCRNFGQGVGLLPR
jgi:DNA-binding SARP family transcriptional activator